MESNGRKRSMKRLLILVHRWLGVALCLLFLIWFPSGIGMMYWGFPDVTERDRLGRAPALDAAPCGCRRPRHGRASASTASNTR